MQDVLGAVNDFILTYVSNNEVGPLQQPQIVRGWQNIVSALPKDCQEYAVLTLLQTIRHGTNVRLLEYPDEGGIYQTVSRMAEHIVQVDFCSAYPHQTEEVARMRAELMEMLHRDKVAVDFYSKYGFSSCYAEDLRALPFQNESEQWVARYIVTLHLSGWTSKNFEEKSFFDKVKIKIGSATQEGYLTPDGIVPNSAVENGENGSESDSPDGTTGEGSSGSNSGNSEGNSGTSGNGSGTSGSGTGSDGSNNKLGNTIYIECVDVHHPE